jgi:16S rRNA (cytosine1407-C5)-methyltransferase
MERLPELPVEFLDRLARLVPAERLADVRSTFDVERPTTFRANVARRAPDQLRRELEAAGLGVEPVAWCPFAFVLRAGTDADLRATEAYRAGELCVQGLASMVPPLVLAPRPGESVLDMCAAPGGKTTQMAAAMGGRGTIVACDASPVRFQKLKALVRVQGCADACELVRGGAKRLLPARAASFDRVLLDAPCSSEGRFRTDRPETWRGWSLAVVAKRAALQRELLAAALDLVRPGGTVVYSTCTLSPEENEEVLQTVLATGAAELLPVELALPATVPAVAAWEGRTFHSTTPRALRLLPTPDTEAFFVARLRRREA